MRDIQNSDAALSEFRKFIEFLGNLWAALASTSVLFPLSNQLAQVIPLSKWPGGGLVYIASSIVTTITTLAALFMVLWVFAKREYFARPKAWQSLPKGAALSFAAGIIALLTYLSLEYLISHDFYFRVLKWESDDLRCIVGDLCLLITYVTFFTLITRAFLLLGIREFLRKERKAA